MPENKQTNNETKQGSALSKAAPLQLERWATHMIQGQMSA